VSRAITSSTARRVPLRGFVNIRFPPRCGAPRGWARHDAGYIDNVRASALPTGRLHLQYGDPGLRADPEGAKDNFNDVDTYGARAALRVDLNDSWSITPSVMGQKQDANGTFGYDRPSATSRSTSGTRPSRRTSSSSALTVEGKIGNFDLSMPRLP